MVCPWLDGRGLLRAPGLAVALLVALLACYLRQNAAPGPQRRAVYVAVIAMAVVRSPDPRCAWLTAELLLVAAGSLMGEALGAGFDAVRGGAASSSASSAAWLWSVRRSQCFSDARLEGEFVTARFIAAGPAFVAYAVMMVGLNTFLAIAVPGLAKVMQLVMVPVCAIISGGRAWLLYTPDQQRARIIFGRLYAGTFLYGMTAANICAHVGLVSNVGVRGLIAGACLLGTAPVYSRLSGLHEAHRFALMAAVPLALLRWSSAWTTVSQPAAILVFAFCQVCGDWVGGVAEWHLRTEFQRRAAAESRASLAADATQHDDACAKKSGGQPDKPQLAAAGSAQRAASELPDAQQLRLHPLWMTFSDRRVEERYTSANFRASRRQLVALSSVGGAGVVTLSLAVPAMHSWLLIVGLVAAPLATFRVLLAGDADQQEARVFFGRCIAIGFLACHAALLRPEASRAWASLRVSGLADGEEDVFGAHSVPLRVPLLLAAFADAAFPFILRFGSMHWVHRCVVLATVAVTVTLRRAILLERPVDAAVICGAMLLLEVVGFTMELTQRQAYLDTCLAEREVAEVQVVAGRARRDIAEYFFHELRNDANAMVGVFDILVERAGTGDVHLPDKLWAFLRDGQVHARHAVQVITNVLDFTKLQTGELKLPGSEPFLLDSLVEECRVLTSHLVRGKPVVLAAAVRNTHAVKTGMSLVALEGAPFHLKQVLVNLLTNALKYTDTGSVALSAVVEPVAGESEHHSPERVAVRFTVADTGVGVPEAHRTAIFEQFEQGPKVGTGLGLPLARSIVTLMGGDLRLESPAEGPGAVFTFCCNFKRQQSPSPLITPASPVADRVTPLPSGLRVLVADDMRLNRALLIRLLHQVLPAPFETREASSGEEALELLLAGDFDLAFLDQHYGNECTLRGTDVARHLRRKRPAGRRIVLVCVTGNQGESFDANACHEGLMDAVWGKPLPSVNMACNILRHLLE